MKKKIINNKNTVVDDNNNKNDDLLKTTIKSNTLYARCCFEGCYEEATWVMGTWQCCDKCAKKWIKEEENGYGYSPWGTSSRAGQELILKHNLQYNLKCYLVYDNKI